MKIFKSLIFISLLLPVFLPVKTVFALASDCQAEVAFDANPKTVTASQNLTLTGWVRNTASTASGGYCNGSNVNVNQFKIYIIETSQNKTITNFIISLSGKGSNQIDFPPQIFSPQSAGYTSGSMSLVARVAAMDAAFTFLTQSTPVPITISGGTGAPVKTPTDDKLKTTTDDNLKKTTDDNLGSANPNPITELYNPIPKQEGLTTLLISIMKAFLGIIGIWAVAFIVIGGFKMVLSQGNEESLASAKKTILWAVLGLVAAVMSFAIIAVVQNFIGVDVKTAFMGLVNAFTL